MTFRIWKIPDSGGSEAEQLGLRPWSTRHVHRQQEKSCSSPRPEDPTLSRKQLQELNLCPQHPQDEEQDGDRGGVCHPQSPSTVPGEETSSLLIKSKLFYPLCWVAFHLLSVCCAEVWHSALQTRVPGAKWPHFSSKGCVQRHGTQHCDLELQAAQLSPPMRISRLPDDSPTVI